MASTRGAARGRDAGAPLPWLLLLALAGAAAAGRPSVCAAGGECRGEQLLLQVKSRATSLGSDARSSRARGSGLPVITVHGRELRVDGQSLHLKGICWNPTDIGEGVRDHHFVHFVTRDIGLIASAGINAVRTYGPLDDFSVLDALWDHGIWVVPTVYMAGSESVEGVRDIVNRVKDHPAILMWQIGNEWNYQGFYTNLPFDESLRRVRRIAEIIKEADPTRPVATVYGGLPTKDIVDGQPNIDVWGTNYYNELSFGNIFEQWKGIAEKPLYVAEYGADAWNSLVGREDDEAQAKAVRVLTQDIMAHSAVKGGVVTGGFLFEWADEWWKDMAGSQSAHDVGGVAPGGGPYPDRTFNEEWWGVVDITRGLRPAYFAYAEEPVPRPATAAPEIIGTQPTTAATTAPPETTTEATTTTAAPETTATTTPPPATTSTEATTGEEDEELPAITVNGPAIEVGGVALHLKGVCWHPVPKGEVRDLPEFGGPFLERDAQLMADAGINAVRTFEPLSDRRVLDTLWSKGIWVVPNVLHRGDDSLETIAARVDAVKDHPAILMWELGGEWNYNGLLMGLQPDVSAQKVREAAAVVRSHDPHHRPIATVYGGLPTRAIVEALPQVDVWGFTYFNSLEMNAILQQWPPVSQKPVYLAQYGADAWNAHIGSEDQASQAKAVTALAGALRAQSVVAGGLVSGGFIFAWSDEWWKDPTGSATAHDSWGFAPGSGPYPDATFNEEWWGLVDIDRAPREAYFAYKAVAPPEAPESSTSPAAQGSTVAERQEHLGAASVIASWTNWASTPMQAEGEGFTTSVTIGQDMHEEFQIVLDHDRSKTLHPSAPAMEDEASPIMGPDNDYFGKNWVIRGDPGTVVNVILRPVAGGGYEIAVAPQSSTPKVWRSGRSP